MKIEKMVENGTQTLDLDRLSNGLDYKAKYFTVDDRIEIVSRRTYACTCISSSIEVRVNGGDIFCVPNTKNAWDRFKMMSEKFGNVSYTTESEAANGRRWVRTVSFDKCVPYLARYGRMSRLELDRICDVEIKEENKFYAENENPS